MGAESGTLLGSVRVLELKIGAKRMSIEGPCVCIRGSAICWDRGPTGNDTELITVGEVSDISE